MSLWKCYACGAMCAFDTLRINLCHCERSVAISRKGHLIKTMMRCFCLWQKRCAYGAMYAYGTLRIMFVIASVNNVPHGYTVSRGVPVSHELSGSWKNSKRRKLSVFNRVDRFLSGYPKYRYKACEKCRGDAAQKDNSDLANSVT